MPLSAVSCSSLNFFLSSASQVSWWLALNAAAILSTANREDEEGEREASAEERERLGEGGSYAHRSS